MDSNKFFFILDSDIVFYYTHFFEEDGFLLVNENDLYLFVDDRYYHEALGKVPSNCTIYNIREYKLKDFIEKNNIKELGIIKSSTNVTTYERLLSFGVTIYDCEDEILKKTSIKREDELETIKKACEISEKSYEETIEFIRTNKENITENEVAAYLEYRFRANGADGIAFETIVAFGKNAAIPHHSTDSTKLQNNECILIDFGCKYHGFCSDITRMSFNGTPDEEFLKVFECVKNAHLKASEEIKEGDEGKTADLIARDYIESNGYGDFFTHSLGHGVGVKIHESPRVSFKSTDKLDDMSVFTIEPGIYLPDKFGVRLENTVVMKNGRCESLFTESLELKII